MNEIKADQEIQEGKFFALISYISFLCIVTLVLKRDNKFAVYHAKHGLVLFVLEVAAFILSVLPFLGGLLRTLGLLLFTLASVWGILQALMGNYSRIPLISDIAEKVTI